MTAEEGGGGRRRLVVWSVVGVVAVGGLTAAVLLGANRPADPEVLAFGDIAFRIQGGPAGDAAQRCALLADTPEQHQRGLMGRTELGGYDGMVFRFPADTSDGFYMKDTLIPLSVAWFDADGLFVSAADMEPCPDDVGCPTYSPAAPYRYALEVPKGNLPALGIGPGARLVLGGDCP